jgi:lysozyme
MNDLLLEAQLNLHEDKRKFPYRDTVGKLTIGVGRNLDDRGLSDDEIAYLLANDIKMVKEDLDRALPWWRQMDAVRQRVLADMCFNLGISRLLLFRNTLKAMKEGDYALAASGMRNSLWYKQVGTRGIRLVKMMETGEDYMK